MAELRLLSRSRYKFLIIFGLSCIISLFFILQSQQQQPLQFQSSTFFRPCPSQKPPLDIDFVEKTFFELDQKDAQLIEYVRARYLTPPSKLPYQLQHGPPNSSEYGDYVIKFFRNKTNGVFIEARAYDGEGQGRSQSHTLYLEAELGWTGLLVECNPTVVPLLKKRNRKAWVAGACMAPSSTPGILNFSHPAGGHGWTYYGTFRRDRKSWKSVPEVYSAKEWVSYNLETIPLYTLLAAIDLFEVDFFSFDIEGLELRVLEQFPFELVTINLMLIEVRFYNQDEVKRLNDLLERNGYQLVKTTKFDRIYVHESAKHLIPVDS